MYKKPITDIEAVNTARAMMGISVSNGTPTDTSNPPAVGAPARGDVIE